MPGVIHADEPDVVIGARQGSPLVVGVGIEEAFLASDPLALLQVTDRFIYLEEGDAVRLSAGGGIEIFDASGQAVEREVRTFEHGDGSASKGEYRHFMLKEIHEQPAVIAETLEGRLGDRSVLVESFGPDAEALLAQVARSIWWPAEPAIMPVSWPATGSSVMPAYRYRWRSPPSIAIAAWWCPRTRCS